MRDKNLSFIQFISSVENFLSEKIQSPSSLRTAVIDSPTLLERFYWRYPRSYNEILGLVVLHHYLPETLRWRVFLDLSDMSLSQLNVKQKIVISLCLSSKENMLHYLYNTETLSSHEVFGNVFGTGILVFQHLHIRKRNISVTLPQRKRGYDDKGSLRPREKWLPNFDFSLKKLQNEKEKKLDLLQKTINRILQKWQNSVKG